MLAVETAGLDAAALSVSPARDGLSAAVFTGSKS
jgi:hypothetical protein